MKKYFAKPGEIPKQGEVWLPIGDKGHLMMIHLIDIGRVRPFSPCFKKVTAPHIMSEERENG